MPAHRKMPTPPEQLRAHLASCRAAGIEFEEAWRRAFGTTRCRGVVRFPHATRERRDWKLTLDETRDEWAAAYDGEATPFSEAIERVLGLVRDEADRAEPATLAGSGATRTAFVLPAAGVGAPHKRQSVAA